MFVVWFLSYKKFNILSSIRKRAVIEIFALIVAVIVAVHSVCSKKAY